MMGRRRSIIRALSSRSQIKLSNYTGKLYRDICALVGIKFDRMERLAGCQKTFRRNLNKLSTLNALCEITQNEENCNLSYFPKDRNLTAWEHDYG